ncbi:MAG TPA: inositol-1-monophosphatase, partial [Rhodospirillaceae bacterium]|nr:inositol-1-monophosphatase [Rhodospirillaceae bacterium]
MLNIKSESVEKAIIEVADQYILPRFRALKSHDIHFKSDHSPVTIADIEAESALQQRLFDLLPPSKLVGEERFASDSGVLDSFLGEEPVWIVDPLDGTKAFIAGEPVLGVIVALAKQNQTIAAWLYDPTSREFITAEKGAGAFYKGKRLSVLPVTQLNEMHGIIGSRIVDAYEDCYTSSGMPSDLDKP